MSAEPYERVARVEFEGVVLLDDRDFDELLPDDESAAEPEPVAAEKVAEPSELEPDPDLSTMAPHEREDWPNLAANNRVEYKRRLRLVVEFDREHHNRRTATAERSEWSGVPLDNLIDQIVAGTLEIPRPTVGLVSGGPIGLFYESRVNGIAGESGAGKGWIALAVAIEQMKLGRTAFYIDFEDTAELSLLRLLAVLKADPEMVRRQFVYLHPKRHDDAQIAEFVDEVRESPNAFAVVDSTGEAMAAADLDGNVDREVARWMQRLAHPLAGAGATVLLLDHLVKSLDGGMWPTGSQRKRAAVTGAQYIAEVAIPFSKDKDGLVALKVAKDRHGAREARSVASYAQMVHPIISTRTRPDGAVDAVIGESLTVVFGAGKTAAQAQAAKDAKAAAALASDVAQIVGMKTPPRGYRDVKAEFGWRDDRAQAAMREWKRTRP